MFFHRKITKKDYKPVKAKSVEELNSFYKNCGLKPIKCVTPVHSFMLNDFGHIRNDIQAFMMTNDPQLQASIERNLNTVTQSGANAGLKVEDIRDLIVPVNVQTPADIAQFGRVLAKRFEGRPTFSTPLADLQRKQDDGVSFDKGDATTTDNN